MKKASVIMASFLGEYEGCATDRENKFIRAVHSFLSNDYKLKELVVVSDCCELTVNILNDKFKEELQLGTIKLVRILKKKKIFSGKVRTAGIEIATGDIIMYLDTDDMIGDKHISAIMNQMEEKQLDWCYYSDYMNTERGLLAKEVEVKHESIGTSSIAHKNNQKINWRRCNGYGHDYKFVLRLKKWSDNYSKIYGTTYIICHIPDMIDM